MAFLKDRIDGCIHVGVVSEDPPGKFRPKELPGTFFQVSSFYLNKINKFNLL